MPDLAAILRSLQWFTLAAYVGLLLKIYFEPVLHRYRYFAIYLAVMASRGVLLLIVPEKTTLYGWIFIFSAPVVWVCYILVVTELYSLVLAEYKGIATFGRYTLGVALGFSVLLAGSTLIFDLSSRAEQFPILLAVFATERWVISSLVILLILITAVLLWFPMPLSRNVVVHSLVYFLYFLSKALALFFRNTMGPTAIHLMNTVVMCTAAACLMIWLLFLSREGERKVVKNRIQWDQEAQDRLLQQLDSINASLLRSARKCPDGGNG
jgi:hypothetical protein